MLALNGSRARTPVPSSPNPDQGTAHELHLSAASAWEIARSLVSGVAQKRRAHTTYASSSLV